MSVVSLAGGIDLSIFINDIELPLDYFTCPVLQIDESDEFGIPILMMQLVDNSGGGILKSLSPIPDGALITVTLETGDISITREFRMSWCLVDGPKLIVRAYLNHPNYIVTSERSVIRGTSREAFEIIANKCGLVLDCPVTSDRMLWQPVNQRLINFARYILRGAYIKDDSLMTGRIRLDGIMKIVDVTTLESSKGLFGFGQGAIPAYGFLPLSNPTENIHGGYRQELAAPNMYGVYDSIIDIEMEQKETSLNRNPKLASLSNFGSVKYGAVSHDANSHDNYNRAVYNNSRLDKLYSMKASLALTSVITNLDALDVLTLDNKTTTDGTASGTSATQYDGDWLISSKSLYIENSQYFERFNLMRSGLNLDMHQNTI